MNAIGKIESFNEKPEKWETYVEHVEQLFLVNNIDDNHQVPTLDWQQNIHIDEIF